MPRITPQDVLAGAAVCVVAYAAGYAGGFAYARIKLLARAYR